MRCPQRVGNVNAALPPKFDFEQRSRATLEEDLAPLAVGFSIVFGEADPPFAKHGSVERVVLDALAK
jgi:hypothetical protein